MGSIAWFARNRVAANLLMVVILAAGLLTLFVVKLEVFPELTLDLISVSVPYPGATPEEVEEAINVRIEEAVQGVAGIKRLNSIATEGIGVVTIELERDTDVRKVLDEVKSRVDAIDTFPEDAEEPVYLELTNRRQVINVAIYGDAEERTLRALAERARDDLTTEPEISLVELSNARPYEISIEVSETALRRHGLSFDDVAAAVRRSSLDLPAGVLKTAGGEVLVRTKGQAYTGEEFARVPLLTRPDGQVLRLGDVAEIRDGFADTDQFTRFDGQPAAVVEVFRTGEQAALAIAGKVHDYVARARAWLPEGIHMATWQDASKILWDRLSLLLRNGSQGFLIVFLILALFLRFRLAFWVSLGLPTAFLGAIWLMPSFDVSINLISLFAFILVLGVVVDDAIIVGENIHRQQHATGKGLEGSIAGAREVALPVVFAVLTNVAAFVPLLHVEGVLGKVMRVIPLIVIPTFLFSLLESLWILPAHLSHYRHEKPEPRFWLTRGWRRFQGAFAAGLERAIQRGYRPLLERALEWRYLSVSAALALILLTGALAIGGYIRFTFFPTVEADYVSAAITMPQGTPAGTTSDAVARLEASAQAVRRELEEATGRPVFQHVLAAVGEQPYRLQQSRNAGGTREGFQGAHLGEVVVELVPAEDREIGSDDIVRRWREKTGPIPGALEVDFTASLFSAGEDIHVQLSGERLDVLRRAAAQLKERLARYEGVYDIADTFREGKPELRLRIKPEAQIYGLRQADIARQVRQALYGEEAQRVQRGRDDVKVMVRYPEAQRRSLGDLENMRIRTPDGLEVPFTLVAQAEFDRSLASIRRVDRRRAVSVTATVDPAVGDVERIKRDLRARVLPEILAPYPDVRFSFEGQQKEQQDTIRDLSRGFGLALFLIFALLAVPLRSYVQPLLIMVAIPFGIVGAIWGHVLLGINLTIMSLFGVVALAGVAVNDSLVMVTFVNRACEAGASVSRAAHEAGVVRFRPILLTSLTTFGGLTPLLLEKSMQARFLIPMATSLAFGVLFSTLITLLIVPCLYLILEDLQRLARRWLGRPGIPERDAAERAA